MSSEETLIQTRKDKHLQINGGKYVLASTPEHRVGLPVHVSIERFTEIMFELAEENRLLVSLDPQELSGVPQYTIHGRITNIRKSGAITFIKISDVSGMAQVIVSKSSYGEDQYNNLKLFDLGDIIEVSGYPCSSKTAEYSMLGLNVHLLTKARRPLPEKFAGIANTEIKYRKRYIDLLSSEESRARFIVRTLIVRAIREYMDRDGFLEVETPTLNVIASGANAKPFITHHNALDMELRLRVAPELYLKRLLVGGLDRVYEIGRNYRNEGIDTRHNPEFSMMESYEAYGNFPELITHTQDLIHYVYKYCSLNLPDNVQSFFRKWIKESTFSLSQFVEVTMLNAVVQACRKASLDWDTSVNLLPISILDINNPRLSKIDLKGMTHSLDQCFSEGERLYVLFEYVVEPFLTEDYRTNDGELSVPVFITEYPKEISPLARAKDSNPLVVDRFELFIDGRELANAFQELNDPDEQALRFREQLESNNKDPMAFDADYIEALEYGMPPAIGFGMGIDRLVMLMTNAPSIKDVILFPTLRTEK